MKKKIFLLATIFLAALIFWLMVKPLMTGPVDFQEISIWLWLLVLLAILTGTMALSFLLLKPKMIWLAIASNLAIFILFFNPREAIVWGGAMAALLFQIFAWRAIGGENGNRLRLDLKSVLRPGLVRLVTSILILISFGYFLSGGVREAAQRKELPEAIRKTVQMVVGNYVSENLESQSPSLRAKAAEKLLDQINNFLKPYFVFLPPILAFSLFLVLRGLSAIFVWLAVFWALLIFWVLKLLKLVKIEKEPKEAEVIQF